MKVFGILAFLILTACTAQRVYVNEANSTHDLALKMSLKIAAEKAKADFAIIRIERLPTGVRIQDYARDLMKQYRIGDNYGGRGVLVLISNADKLIKIEVTYPLEGLLPDLITSRLETAAETYLFSDIEQDFYSELLITMSNWIVEKTVDTKELFVLPSWMEGKHVSGGAGYSSQTSRTAHDILRDVKALPESKYVPSKVPDETLETYLTSLASGEGTPASRLITEGSQIFRTIVPRSRAQLMRMGDDYSRSHGHEILREDSRALAVFDVGSSNLPIYMVKTKDDIWLVDEVKTWTYYHRFEDNTEFQFLTDDTPFRDELLKRSRRNARCTIYKKRFQLPHTDFAHEPQSNIEDIGDWNQFEVGRLNLAANAYLAATHERPMDLAPRWKHYHTLINLSRVDEALDELETLYDLSPPEDTEIKIWYRQYKIAYNQAESEFSASPLQKAYLALANLWHEFRVWLAIRHGSQATGLSQCSYR